MSEPALKAWKLPFIVAAIAVAIVLGFYLGGPGLGMAVGGLAAGSIVVMAIRHPPRPAIVPPLAGSPGRYVLIVLACAIDDATAGVVAGIVGEGGAAADALLISPCRSRFLDRWACDLDAGRHRAQQDLVLSAATLAKAGVHATARVGDEDLVQMTEDVLRTYPATEVLLVGGGEADPWGEEAAMALGPRLRVPLRAIQPSLALTSRSPTSSELRAFSSP